MKNMRRWIACLAVVLLCMQPAMADEGMWLMHRLAEIYPQMKARGLKIKDKEIYNEKSAALADAVVAVDGGMGTGSMISDQGLMITNHHVAYSDICALSTPECNLLETGFWARTRDEEIPVPGKTVWFVRKVVDVTDEANALKEEMKAAGKWGMMAPRRLYAELEGNGIKDPEYSIECGVQELKAALTSAEVENPIDMERIKLALQGYNFGNGYISWAKTTAYRTCFR